MTTKYTPGPWIVRDSDFGSEVWITTKKRNANNTVEICTVDAGFDEPFESEQQANARLIAAAPELLEALLNALPYVEDVLSDKEQLKAFKVGVVAKHVEQIHLTIAKALGGTE